MKKGKLIALIVVFVLVLVAAVIGYPILSGLVKPEGAQEKLAAISENATASFTETDMEGNQAALSDFFGKPVVVRPVPLRAARD